MPKVKGSLADAIAPHVTDPLGMRDTAFTVREPARLATPYADGTPCAVRMTEPCPVQDLIFSPARAFNGGSFQSGGGGMVGTAGDFMTFLESVRCGGAPILNRDTVAMASSNQVGALREQGDPGWGFGFLSGVLIDPRARSVAVARGDASVGRRLGQQLVHRPDRWNHGGDVKQHRA